VLVLPGQLISVLCWWLRLLTYAVLVYPGGADCLNYWHAIPVYIQYCPSELLTYLTLCIHRVYPQYLFVDSLSLLHNDANTVHQDAAQAYKPESVESIIQ